MPDSAPKPKPILQEDGSYLFHDGIILQADGTIILPNGSKLLPAKKDGALLQELTFKVDHRNFKKGKTLTFREGVNFLVGEQGCGKSTTLSAIGGFTSRMQHEREDSAKVVKMTMQECRIAYKDFEKDNPRTKSYFEDNVGFQLSSMYSSHGESVRAMLAVLHEQFTNQGTTRTVLLFDEPDMALSPRSAHILARIFQEIADHGHQVIAAVHNPIVIASQPMVYSLEHNRWMKSSTFLSKHEQEAVGGFDTYLKPVGNAGSSWK